MALAWKAGWVQALTSSNLVSSATVICALTRAYAPHRAPLEVSGPLSVRYFCAIFRGGPLRGGRWRPLRQGCRGEFVQFHWLHQGVNKVPPGCRSSWSIEPFGRARPAVLVSGILQSSA